MTKSKATRVAAAALSIGMMLCAFGSAGWGTQAVVLTSTGHVIEGSLSGLAAVIRLTAPESATFIGYGGQIDIPLEAIRQITLDFPRVVIETDARVVVGPFSTFRGIDELLRIQRGGDLYDLPTPSVRAIALHGSPLRPVPREWLGSGYLDMPEIVAATRPGPVSSSDRPAVPDAAEADFTPIWSDFTPTVPPAEAAETPWWVGLLIVAALIAVVYLLMGQGA